MRLQSVKAGLPEAAESPIFLGFSMLSPFRAVAIGLRSLVRSHNDAVVEALEMSVFDGIVASIEVDSRERLVGRVALA